jgi:hypothetical protein
MNNTLGLASADVWLMAGLWAIQPLMTSEAMTIQKEGFMVKK